LEYLPLFYDDLDYGVHVVELIAALFDDNDAMLSFNLYPLFKRLASTISKIAVESPKKATLMSFLSVFISYKGTYIADN
jgi:hypothetical protein